MTNGASELFARAARSARFRVLAAGSLALALAACSDDGGTSATSGDGGGSSQGGGGTGATGQGGAGSGGGATSGSGGGGGMMDPQFEGTFWVESHLHVGGTSESAAYGLFWEVGSAQGSLVNWYDDVIGSAEPLAEGECALITDAAAPTYTPLTVGPSVYVRDGSTDLIETLGPPTLDDYYGDGTAANATTLHAGTFTLAIDPGEGSIMPQTSSPLGPLVDVTVPTNPSCPTNMDCDLVAAPSAPVDDMLVMFDLTYVCRGNPTTGAFTLPTDVLLADGDNVANVQVYAVKRQTAEIGSSTIETQLVTRSEFLLELL